MERTLILVKPDAMQRALAGEIIGRFERRGLKIVGLKLMHIGKELARQHYKEHTAKPFFTGLVEYISSSPIIAMVLEGPGAIDICRTAIGATNPQSAAPGSIRGDLAIMVGRNLVHGSDSPSSAKHEIDLFFSAAELIAYERADDRWVME